MRVSRKHILPLVGGTMALTVLAGCGSSLLGATPRTGGVAAKGALPQAEAWQAYPDAPSARFNGGGVAIGFSLFVVGGYNDALGRLASTEKFTAFDKWASAPAMPTSRSSLMAATVPYARVLAIGGNVDGHPVGTNEMYSMEKNEWTRMAEMPTPRWGAGANGHGVFAYVAGGAAMYPSKALERFDVRDNTWTKLPDMKVGREGCVAAVIGQRLAVVGGRTSGGETGTLELYNWEKNEWTTAAPMPTPRSYPAFAVIGHHLFVLGGRLASGETDVVESFDLASGKWTTRTPLPAPLAGAVASKLGERLVVTGGFSKGHASAKTWGIPLPFKAEN